MVDGTEACQGIVIPFPGSSRLRAFSCDGSDNVPSHGRVPVTSERPHMLRCTFGIIASGGKRDFKKSFEVCL